jgi:hypothetical protein
MWILASQKMLGFGQHFGFVLAGIDTGFLSALKCSVASLKVSKKQLVILSNLKQH